MDYNVATKVTKIVYAVLRDGVEFDPEPSKGRSKNRSNKKITLVERRLIRRARRVLQRINQVETSENLGMLKCDIENIANELNSLLKGKKIK